MTEPLSHYDKSQLALGTIYVSALGIYVINDYTTPLGAPLWRLFYAMIFTTIVGIGALQTIRSGRILFPRGLVRAFCLVVTLTATGLVMALTQDKPNVLYLIGDFATAAMLVVTMYMVAQLPILYAEARHVRLLVVILFVAAVVGIVVGGQFQGERFAGRFDPPHVVLFAAVLGGFLSCRRRYVKWAWTAAAIVLIYLALKSGQRTAPVVFGLLALTAMLAALGGLRGVTALLVLTAAAVGVFSFFGDRIVDLLRVELTERAAEFRYAELVESGGDESIEGRLFEAADVLEIARNSDPLTLILGHGHGATYAPMLSFPEPNVTELGRVHNIHIGPALLLFRYGLLGLAFYVLIGAVLAVDFFRIHSYRRIMLDGGRADDIFVFATLYFAMVGAFINFHMRTVLNDPVWSLVLASYFAVRGMPGSIVKVANARFQMRVIRPSIQARSL